MKNCKLSFSPYSMVNRSDEERFCLYPPIKLLTNNLLNSSKEPTIFRGILLNHTRAGSLSVVGKALHIISYGTPWRCIVVLNIAIWSQGSHIPSYESKEGILNLGGKGWLLMEAMKWEFVRWTKSSMGNRLIVFYNLSSCNKKAAWLGQDQWPLVQATKRVGMLLAIPIMIVNQHLSCNRHPSNTYSPW